MIKFLKDKFLYIAFVVVVLGIVLIGKAIHTSSTTAKYITTADGSDTARVAKWDIDNISKHNGATLDVTTTFSKLLESNTSGMWFLEFTNNSEVTAEINDNSSVTLRLDRDTFSSTSPATYKWSDFSSELLLRFFVDVYQGTVDDIIKEYVLKSDGTTTITKTAYSALSSEDKDLYLEVLDSENVVNQTFFTIDLNTEFSRQSQIEDGALVYFYTYDISLAGLADKLLEIDDSKTVVLRWTVGELGSAASDYSITNEQEIISGPTVVTTGGTPSTTRTESSSYTAPSNYSAPTTTNYDDSHTIDETNVESTHNMTESTVDEVTTTVETYTNTNTVTVTDVTDKTVETYYVLKAGSRYFAGTSATATTTSLASACKIELEEDGYGDYYIKIASGTYSDYYINYNRSNPRLTTTASTAYSYNTSNNYFYYAASSGWSTTNYRMYLTNNNNLGFSNSNQTNYFRLYQVTVDTKTETVETTTTVTRYTITTVGSVPMFNVYTLNDAGTAYTTESYEFFDYVKYLSSIGGEAKFTFAGTYSTYDVFYSNLTDTQLELIQSYASSSVAADKVQYLRLVEYEKYLDYNEAILNSQNYGGLTCTFNFKVVVSQVD